MYLGREKKSEITSSLLQNRIEKVSELVTLDYKYTKMVSYKNMKTFYGWEVPFTEKKFIISYNGSIKSGINLANLKIDVDNNNKVVEIDLPEAKIIAHEIDENSIKVFDEKNSIFNPLKVEDFKDFATDEKEHVESESIKKGLLDEARSHAEKAITDILGIDGLLDNYKIIFKD